MKRLILTLLLICPLWTFVWAQHDIVILHTNDTHSQIEAFVNKQGKKAGGIYNRAALIDQIKKDNQNVLLVDAGDFSQGTPYFNFFKGKQEIKFMNLLGYQVGCFGNHEFDNGSAALAKLVKQAKFPFVCANYYFFNKKLQKSVKKYTIIEIDGKKIGFFGLLTDIKTITVPKSYSEIKYLNAIDIAECMVKELRDVEKCDYVVCLSHLGFDTGTEDNPDDKMLAEQVSGIDLIIGGHSHTTLKEPVLINGTYIVQTGKKGESLGKVVIKQ